MVASMPLNKIVVLDGIGYASASFEGLQIFSLHVE